LPAAWQLQPVSAPDTGGHEIVDRTLVSSCFHHVTVRTIEGVFKIRKIISVKAERVLFVITKVETVSHDFH
jgi:hypothetical protein